jgi:hypothetical protein
MPSRLSEVVRLPEKCMYNDRILKDEIRNGPDVAPQPIASEGLKFLSP